MEKRILMIGPLPPPYGGATILFKRIIEHFEDRNIDFKVMDKWKADKNIFLKCFSGLKLLIKFIFIIHKYDCVIFFGSVNSTFYIGSMISFICKFFKKPFILRVFGGKIHSVYDKLSKIKKNILDQTLLKNGLLLFETLATVNYFKKNIKNDNIKWHPNFRKINFKKGISKKCKKIIFLGAVKPSKGINVILESADNLDESVEIDVYGPLEEGIRKEDFNKNTNINYRGILDSDEIITTLKKYDLLILPTFFPAEGYPGVIIEAYSVGIPVITTNWRAIPEIVDEKSGILIQTKNSEALSEAINILVKNAKLYRSKCLGAKEKAQEFSLKYWGDELLKNIDDLIIK